MKLLLVHELEWPGFRRLTATIEDEKEAAGEHWDYQNPVRRFMARSSKQGDIKKRTMAFDPDIVDCPRCGGSTLEQRSGVLGPCSLCEEGYVSLGQLNPLTLDITEVYTITKGVQREYELYGAPSITPNRLPYWLLNDPNVPPASARERVSDALAVLDGQGCTDEALLEVAQIVTGVKVLGRIYHVRDSLRLWEEKEKEE